MRTFFILGDLSLAFQEILQILYLSIVLLSQYGNILTLPFDDLVPDR